MYHIMTGVTSDVGVPLTYLVCSLLLIYHYYLFIYLFIYSFSHYFKISCIYRQTVDQIEFKFGGQTDHGKPHAKITFHHGPVNQHPLSAYDWSSSLGTFLDKLLIRFISFLVSLKFAVSQVWFNTTLINLCRGYTLNDTLLYLWPRQTRLIIVCSDELSLCYLWLERKISMVCIIHIYHLQSNSVQISDWYA